MNPFEMKGIWWLPGEEDIQVKGVLRFSPSEGGTLELLGTFRFETKVHYNTFLINKDIILGLVNGHEITCYKCLNFNYTGSETLSTATYRVSYIFEGYHFLREEDICFDSISVNYSHFEDWLLGLIGYYEGNFNQDSSGKITLSLNYVLEKNEIKLYECSKFTLSLISYINIKEKKEKKNSIILEQNKFLKIVSEDAIHFNDWINGTLFDLRNLLSLSLDIPVFPVSISGTNKNKKITHYYTKKEHLPEIKIFYGTSSSFKKVNSSNTLFTYNDFKEKTNLYFSNWFRISTDLKPMINLYLGNLYNNEMFLEFKFLSLAQAIEFYHRKRFEGYYLEPQEFHEIHFVLSETIKNYTDKKIDSIFINKLGYLNQYTFKKRIKEVLSHLNKKGLLKWNKNKRDSFAQNVGDYRDTLTHYENIDYSTLDFNELKGYVNEMKTVLAKCLLYEIFNEE
jgi:hypothetical protein